MRIIVFGGAGDMGSRAVEDLADASGVDQVTIADREVTAADKLAATLRGRGAQVDVKAVDANDHDALVEAMQGYDVAASSLGPFYRFETRLIRAAIEAGVDYASICDDWSAAQSVLDEFD
ncbi:MAG: NmrA family NAD(P)-binding protein, partial [Gemmatimonadales bacterium]|nr:NmrA family NAD(P)-binding protein [Gemmatimonadales bacterium]